jgi:hypothetical protein
MHHTLPYVIRSLYSQQLFSRSCQVACRLYARSARMGRQSALSRAQKSPKTLTRGSDKIKEVFSWSSRPNLWYDDHWRGEAKKAESRAKAFLALVASFY